MTIFQYPHSSRFEKFERFERFERFTKFRRFRRFKVVPRLSIPGS
jgi:hypothetical protein